jgi:hypothetical protein
MIHMIEGGVVHSDSMLLKGLGYFSNFRVDTALLCP